MHLGKAVLTTIVLVTGAVLKACARNSTEAVSSDVDVQTPSVGPDSPDCPVRNHLAAEMDGRTRRGVEVPADYAFLEAREGGCLPVRFNPCKPIHYVVNPALAPTGAMDDLQQAIQRLEQATGLVFVNDGATEEPADATRRRFQPERYGNRWAPVLTVWDHGAKFRMEPNNPAGGRSFPVNGVSVTGVLIVNVDAVAQDQDRPASGFGDGTTWGRVFLHELGHLVGLGRVARPDQIMFSELDVQAGPAEYQAGDLAGLRLLGKDAGCLATPSAPRNATRG